MVSALAIQGRMQGQPLGAAEAGARLACGLQTGFCSQHIVGLGLQRLQGLGIAVQRGQQPHFAQQQQLFDLVVGLFDRLFGLSVAVARSVPQLTLPVSLQEIDRPLSFAQ